MSAAGRSLQVFGIYLVVLGAAQILAPNFMLPIFGFPPTQEVWIRVLGLLLLVLGYYYVVVALQDLKSFFIHTVYGRVLAFCVLVGLAATGIAPPMLASFGVVDLLAAAWTWRALRRG